MKEKGEGGALVLIFFGIILLYLVFLGVWKLTITLCKPERSVVVIPLKYQSVIIVEPHVTQVQVNRLVAEYEKIAPEVRRAIEQKKCLIILVNGFIQGRYYGFYDSEENTIRISNISNYIEFSLAHEIGHFVNYVTKHHYTTHFHGKDALYHIYLAEKETLHITHRDDTYHKTNKFEFFAVAYKEIMIGRAANVQTSAPQLYEFIQKRSKEIESSY